MSSASLTRKIGKDLVTAIGYGSMSLSPVYYGNARSDEDRLKVRLAVTYVFTRLM